MLMKLAGMAAVALGVFVPAIAWAELGFPALVTFPGQIVESPDQALLEEQLGEAEFIVAADGTMESRQGHHFSRWLRYRPGPGEPAPGYYNGTEQRIYDAVSVAWINSGWRLVKVDEGHGDSTFTRERAGRTLWLRLKLDAPQAMLRVEMVETGGAGPTLVLPKPAATPETVRDQDDLPYLPPPGGSRLLGAVRGDGPIDVGLPGSGQEMLVGNGGITRNYQGTATLSALQFIADYRAALANAGWRIVYPAEGDANRYASLAAHYMMDGRDIWARLSYEHGANLWFTVADAAAFDLGARLDKECRVPLYGVIFDFDKATIRPDSEPVLQRAAALVRARPKARIEVQGHTDNVGSEAYNLKLSGARAEAVRQWLAQHQVDAGRLAARGYGKNQPVADNGTDAGRARNRRVEIANLACAR